MSAYVITYDLERPHQDYSDLIAQIKAISSTHWHYQQSCWIITSGLSASVILDSLHPYVDSNDSLFVAELSGDWASWGLSKKGTAWLHEVVAA